MRNLDSHHSKLGDSRQRVLEKTVQFGDTPQVVGILWFVINSAVLLIVALLLCVQ